MGRGVLLDGGAAQGRCPVKLYDLGGQSFTPGDLEKLTRPCVYIFLKNGEVLYVGSSANGLIRFASPSHHKAMVRITGDEIRVIWQEDESTARILEARLIRQLRPRYNGKADTRELPALPPRKRRENGSGCIIRLKNCRYWYLRYRVDGHLVSESTKSESREVAEQMLARRIVERNAAAHA
jgi:hypothetical protein